jgi:hypothetical protein
MSTLDFISAYADYADVLEAPRVLHELVAVQLIAAALNRNDVVIRLGAIQYPLDLWALLLSGSGAGRSTTVALFEPVLKAAEMTALESLVRWGSAQAFYQHSAEHPFGLHVWGEMAERLKLLNDPRFAGVKEWLTDRYDNLQIPDPTHYRRTGKKQDTPPIEFEQAPRINILATSSDDWFFRNLAETDSAGGFLARWMILRADETSRVVPVPQAPDASLIPPLAERLKEIAALKGEADLSDIVADYSEWYVETLRRFEAQPNASLARVYFNRHRGHVLKLAAIFEASRTGALKVSRESWQRAVEFARRVEDTIFRLLPTGMSALGYDLQRIEERIKAAGPEGLSQNDLTRSYQSMKKWEREQAIQTLVDAGGVRKGHRQESYKSREIASSSQAVKTTASAAEQPQEKHPPVAATAQDVNAHDVTKELVRS